MPKILPILVEIRDIAECEGGLMKSRSCRNFVFIPDFVSRFFPPL